MARKWTGVLARMGTPTGDGRILDPAGMSFRELPVPLMWQEKTAPGHDGAVTVGTVDSVTYESGMMIGTGRLLDLFPDRDRLIELIESAVVGPSVDLSDNVEYVMDDQERIVITRASIGGVTLVPIEAFSDVSIDMLDGEYDAENEAIAERDAEAGREARPMTAEEGRIIAETLFASATPAPLPPLEWFQRPDLDRLTPVTVSDTGRVFGHIAGWRTCHVGLPGCVTPPPSQSGYQFFTVSSQSTQEGVTVPVGTLVAGPRHADAQAAFRAAMEHYDDPGAAVARVTAGEDEYGIWVAGWMLPGARPEAVDVFTSSPVSGDWRRIGGSLELIAVCSVNAPGFPVPRARVNFSSGAQRTLIASFGITPVSGTWEEAVSGEAFVKTTTDEGRARWAWVQAQEGI